MIDIKKFRENPQQYQNSAKLRGVTVDIDKILKLDAKHVKLIGEVEGLRAQLNLKGKPTTSELEQLKEAKSNLGKLESKLISLGGSLNEGLMQIPNLLAPETPAGGEEANRSEKTWGEAKKSVAKDHTELLEQNDWVDFERGAKVAGAKFYYLKGAAVKLEMAVMTMAMRELESAGFTVMTVPHLVSRRISEGAGFLPRGEEDQNYQIGGEDLILIATAEIPLTGYHADEIIEATKLPLCYVGLSPSYRREAGAYGKHAKGLFRVHQFNKLEMYVFCQPEDSPEWHQKLMDLEEKICQMLEIPYRVVRIAAGDLGAPAFKKYDIEYWSPVDGQYRELMSCSNCTDFQSRRLNIRTRDSGGKTQFVHTLNGTAIAFSRILIALLENHQSANGKVKIPEALQPYYGGPTL